MWNLEPWNFEWLSIQLGMECHHPKWRTHSIIFQFAIYSSCLSSINGPFSCFFQLAIYSSCGMFIIYKWAIFIHFPVRYLFIMFIIYKWAIFYPFSSSLFILHVYHL
jgi:hypothetical protein